MKRSLLIGALGGLLLVGPAASFGQKAQVPAQQPQQQPSAEAAPPVEAADAVLGTVRIPRAVKADGKPLPPGTYQVRITKEEAPGKATGATPSYERFAEFVQGGQVKGREVASVIPDADIAKVANAAKPAQGRARVEMLKGDEFLRVWIHRGDNHYLIHLPPA